MDTAGISMQPVAARLATSVPAYAKASTGSQGGGANQAQTAPSQPGATSATGEPLTTEQQNQVRDLKKRDAEVKAHEQAHAAVGGSYASAPKYTYTQGPDGKKYAVGGEVQIDTSPERTPEATIRKMDIVIAAALAPAEPSSQDQAVARQAQQQRQQAQADLQEQRAAERKAPDEDTPDTTQAGLPNDLFAQLVGQADDPQSVTPSDASQAAASAYADAAALTAQVFGV